MAKIKLNENKLVSKLTKFKSREEYFIRTTKFSKSVKLIRGAYLCKLGNPPYKRNLKQWDQRIEVSMNTLFSR